jgi:hypothetical protein
MSYGKVQKTERAQVSFDGMHEVVGSIPISSITFGNSKLEIPKEDQIPKTQKGVVVCAVGRASREWIIDSRELKEEYQKGAKRMAKMAGV